MTEKEKADCLIELLKEESKRQTQLINLEFKVNILLWSFIILAGYFLLKEILPNSSSNQAFLFSIVYCLIAALLIGAHYTLWMFPITKSQATSTYFIRSYQCKIEELAEFSISSNTSTSKPEINSFSQFAQNYKKWIYVEVGITALLLLVIFLFGLFQIIIR